MKTIAALFPFVLLCSVPASAQVAPAHPAPPLPEWGTILGRIVYDGKGQIPAPRMVPINKFFRPGFPAAIEDESLVINEQNSGLANVIVYLRTKPGKIHPILNDSLPQKEILAVRNLRFVPHVLAIWNKDALELQNQENFGVNVKYDSHLQDFNLLLSPTDAVKKQFKTGEVIPRFLSNNIAPWMSGYLLVRDNPYFCVTNERGIFCIPNLPTDEVLEFVFWHERCGYMGGMMNQVPNPAHKIVLNKQGRLSARLIDPVLDLGEFLADPKKLK